MLNEFGYEILCTRGVSNMYYVVDRKFDMPELRILIDAVQAASFITPKKTKEFVDKIAHLSGSRSAEVLKRNVVEFNTAKSTNESIYYAVNEIALAIKDGKQVEFLYFDKDVNKKRVYRKNGAKYLGAADVPHLLLLEVIDKSITSFNVPADTRIIGTAAFRDCTKLEAITLPEGVLSLSSSAFAACTALADVSLPTTLQSIGAYAFAGCEALTDIVIPATTAHIAEKAFYKCIALSEIQLPSGIKTVGAFVFLETALTYTDWDGGKYLPWNPQILWRQGWPWSRRRQRGMETVGHGRCGQRP